MTVGSYIESLSQAFVWLARYASSNKMYLPGNHRVFQGEFPPVPLVGLIGKNHILCWLRFMAMQQDLQPWRQLCRLIGTQF